jgi:hypothetical protein
VRAQEVVAAAEAGGVAQVLARREGAAAVLQAARDPGLVERDPGLDAVLFCFVLFCLMFDWF